ncbi:MAG: FAD binding domain-containing protein [Saprospiraceae bacterium]|jgi:4-hydroxybenzoyl-CoA reductase subunit beta
MENLIPAYLRVTSIEEAMCKMSENIHAILVAGGTDVYVNKQQGNITSNCFVDITGIESLKSIKWKNDFLEIGSLVSLNELANSKEIITSFPALRMAAQSVATPVIRRTATIGGNILCENRCSYYNQSEWWRDAVGYCLKCNGDICIATGGMKNCFSKFVSDTAPVLIALKAKINLIDVQGERTIPVEKLYSGDGVNSLTIDKQTLLKSIDVPSLDAKVIFKKLRPRKALDFTSLTTAISLVNNKDLRMAIGGVDPKPVVLDGNIETDDLALLVKKAYKQARVVENDYYPRNYRKEMIKYFIEQSLDELGILKFK